MEYHNVCTKQVYVKRDGESKTTWLNCGTLKILDDGKKFLTLNMFPDTAFYVFPPKPKEAEIEGEL